jgi:hypothetical protein
VKFFRAQFISTFTTLLLVLCILAPIAVKLSHAIYEHESLECSEPAAIHVHEIELDCDFQKFKLSTQYYSVPTKFENKIVAVERVKNFNFYTFLSKYQKLHFALRGPPVS